MSVYELSSSENLPGAFHGPAAMRGMWAGMVGWEGGGWGGGMRGEGKQVGDGHPGLQGIGI